ncbi:MAG: hypothetical protein ACOCX2_05855 [Armatimonadota bacterium]
MSWSNCEEIYDRLERLSRYETVSTFSLSYFDTIAEYIAGDGRAAEGLRLCFVEFLEVMENYHRALDVFACEDQVTLGNVRAAAQRRDIGLRVLLEQLGADRTRGRAEAGRLLLSAECYYQLAMIERVVEELERAVAAGADDPMAQFALGYNRYELATRAFTRYDPDTGEREVHDADRFRLACLSAVSSMQDGLTGSDFDGELHWWIGNILRAAGFDEASRVSLEKADEIERNREFLMDLEEAAMILGLEIEGDYEYDVLTESTPISEDEVERAGMLLQLSYTQSEIMEG